MITSVTSNVSVHAADRPVLAARVSRTRRASAHMGSWSETEARSPTTSKCAFGLFLADITAYQRTRVHQLSQIQDGAVTTGDALGVFSGDYAIAILIVSISKANAKSFMTIVFMDHSIDMLLGYSFLIILFRHTISFQISPIAFSTNNKHLQTDFIARKAREKATKAASVHARKMMPEMMNSP